MRHGNISIGTAAHSEAEEGTQRTPEQRCTPVLLPIASSSPERAVLNKLWPVPTGEGTSEFPRTSGAGPGTRRPRQLRVRQVWRTRRLKQEAPEWCPPPIEPHRTEVNFLQGFSNRRASRHMTFAAHSASSLSAHRAALSLRRTELNLKHKDASNGSG